MLLDYPHRPIASSDARVDAAARPLSRVPDASPGRAQAGAATRRRERWTGSCPTEFSPSRNLAWVFVTVPRAPASALLRTAATGRRRAFSRSRPTAERSLRAARASSARMRCASLNSGLLPRSGSLCDTTRPRFVSMTSVVWQQGHVDFDFGFEPRHHCFPLQRPCRRDRRGRRPERLHPDIHRLAPSGTLRRQAEIRESACRAKIKPMAGGRLDEHV